MSSDAVAPERSRDISYWMPAARLALAGISRSRSAAVWYVCTAITAVIITNTFPTKTIHLQPAELNSRRQNAWPVSAGNAGATQNKEFMKQQPAGLLVRGENNCCDDRSMVYRPFVLEDMQPGGCRMSKESVVELTG